MEELKAYGSKIVVKLEDGDFSKHLSGLLLPTNDKKRQIMKQNEKRTIDDSYKLHLRNGEVVAVGDKCKYFEVGQTTRVNIHNGVQFDLKGHKYLAIEEIDTQMVVLT